MDPWKKLLRPWAEQHAALLTSLDEHCRSLDDDALQALADSTQRPSHTNCWWAIYNVAPIVREAVATEQYVRGQASAPTSEKDS